MYSFENNINVSIFLKIFQFRSFSGSDILSGPLYLFLFYEIRGRAKILTQEQNQAPQNKIEG